MTLLTSSKSQKLTPGLAQLRAARELRDRLLHWANTAPTEQQSDGEWLSEAIYRAAKLMTRRMEQI